MNDELLENVINNMPEENDIDIDIVMGFVAAAISYAESYQRLPSGTYAKQSLGDETQKAVIQLTTYFYKTRLGFPDGINKGAALWNELNALLRDGRNWDM